MSKVVKKTQAVSDLESALIHFVRARSDASRVDVARRLKLVPSTAGIYVDRLIAEGFLTETDGERSTRTRGRPPMLLRLNPEAGRFVGVDFDARQILAKGVDFAQGPLAEARRSIPARASVEKVLEIIVETVDEVVGSKRNDVLGIGLGVPGPVDPERGVSLRYAFLRGWHDVPVGPYVERRFGVPTFVENNLRSMALAELWTGQARGLRHLVCLGVRSGIGSGIVVDGRLLGGSRNAAGEIGRWIYPGTKGSACEEPSTIEEIASVSALLAAVDLTSAAELSEALARRERRVLAAVKQAAGIHGWVAHQLDALVDPEAIVVSGPLVEHESYWTELVESARGCGGGAADRLRRSTLGPFAGAIGAAALAFQHWKPRR